MNLKCIAWAGSWQVPSNDEVLKFLILNFNQIFYLKHQTDFMSKTPCKNDTLPWEIYDLRAQTQNLILQMLPHQYLWSRLGPKWVTGRNPGTSGAEVVHTGTTPLTPLWLGVFISISAESEPQTWVHNTAIIQGWAVTVLNSLLTGTAAHSPQSQAEPSWKAFPTCKTFNPIYEYSNCLVQNVEKGSNSPSTTWWMWLREI